MFVGLDSTLHLASPAFALNDANFQLAFIVHHTTPQFLILYAVCFVNHEFGVIARREANRRRRADRRGNPDKN